MKVKNLLFNTKQLRKGVIHSPSEKKDNRHNTITPSSCPPTLDSPQIVHKRVLDHKRTLGLQSSTSSSNLKSKSEPGTDNKIMAWAFPKRSSSSSDLNVGKHQKRKHIRPHAVTPSQLPLPPSHPPQNTTVDTSPDMDTSIGEWSFSSKHPTPKAKQKLQRDMTLRHANTTTLSHDSDVGGQQGLDPTAGNQGIQNQSGSKIKNQGHGTKPRYSLPCSIEFLSLMLPHAGDSYNSKLQDERNQLDLYLQSTSESDQFHPYLHCHSQSTSNSTPSLVSSECEDMSYTSVKSGQTALAKDRVQETIASMANIEYYFNHKQPSPRGVDGFDHSQGRGQQRGNGQEMHTFGCANDTLQDDYNKRMNMEMESRLQLPNQETQTIPINVDFVLESSEDELASFAHSCITSGFYRDAIDIYDTILHHYSNKYGRDYGLVVDTLHNLGVIHIWNGNYNRALGYIKESLNLRRRRKQKWEEKHGANLNCHKELDMNFAIAQSLSELGIIFYAKEDFNKALGAMREALQIYSTLGNHRSVNSDTGRNKGMYKYADTYANKGKHKSPQAEYKMARTLNNIGCIHFSMGKLTASLSTFEESLELLRHTMGSCVGDDVDRILFHVSIVQCNAAIVAEKQGDIDVAVSWMEEGLMVQQSVLPDNHRVVTTVSRTLFRLEGREEDFEMSEARDIEIECGQAHLQTHDVHATDIVHHRADQESLNLFCEEMLSLGGPKPGLEINCEKMVQKQMNIHRLPQVILAEGQSKRHCSWVDIRNPQSQSNKGTEFDFLSICKKMAQYIKHDDIDNAVNLLNAIHRSHKSKCGDVSYILGAISYLLGIVFLYTGQYSLALKSLKESIHIRSSALDQDHDDLLASHTMAAIAMIALSEFDSALAKLQKVLHLTRKKYGYSDKRAAVILNNIGICHYELGGVLAASKAMEEAIEILRETSKINQLHDNTHAMDATQLIQVSILTGRCLNNLAFLRFKRKDYSDAIVALEEALKIQRRIFGNDHPVVRDTVESLATSMAIANCRKNKDKLDHLRRMYISMFDSQ